VVGERPEQMESPLGELDGAATAVAALAAPSGVTAVRKSGAEEESSTAH